MLFHFLGFFLNFDSSFFFQTNLAETYSQDKYKNTIKKIIIEDLNGVSPLSDKDFDCETYMDSIMAAREAYW